MVSYMVGFSDVFFDTCLSKSGSLLFDNSSMDEHWVCRHIRRSLRKIYRCQLGNTINMGGAYH
jgi:hypothetical protein